MQSEREWKIKSILISWFIVLISFCFCLIYVLSLHYQHFYYSGELEFEFIIGLTKNERERMDLIEYFLYMFIIIITIVTHNCLLFAWWGNPIIIIIACLLLWNPSFLVHIKIIHPFHPRSSVVDSHEDRRNKRHWILSCLYYKYKCNGLSQSDIKYINLQKANQVYLHIKASIQCNSLYYIQNRQSPEGEISMQMEGKCKITYFK